jgi:hypothetical protein
MLSRVLICMAALLGTACTTAMYSGPRRPPSELAVIASDDSYVSELDHVRAPFTAGNLGKFEVLPGEHAVGITLDKGMGAFKYYSYSMYTICMVALAGKEYRVKIEMLGSMWRPYVVDESSNLLVSYSCSSDISSASSGSNLNADRLLNQRLILDPNNKQ